MKKADFDIISSEVSGIHEDYMFYTNYNQDIPDLTTLSNNIYNAGWEYYNSRVSNAYTLAKSLYPSQFTTVINTLSSDTNITSDQQTELISRLTEQQTSFASILSTLAEEKLERANTSPLDVQSQSTPDNLLMMRSAGSMASSLESFNKATQNTSITSMMLDLAHALSALKDDTKDTLGGVLDSGNSISSMILDQNGSMNSILKVASGPLSAAANIFKGKGNPCGTISIPDIGNVSIGGVEVSPLPILESLSGLNLTKINTSGVVDTVIDVGSELKNALSGGQEGLSKGLLAATSSITESIVPDQTALQKATYTLQESLKSSLKSAATNASKSAVSTSASIVEKALSTAATKLPKEMGDILKKCGISVLRCSTKDLNSILDNILIAIKSGKSNSQSQADCQDAVSNMVSGAVGKIGEAVDTISVIEGSVNSTIIGGSLTAIKKLDTQIDQLGIMITAAYDKLITDGTSNVSSTLGMGTTKSETLLKDISNSGTNSETLLAYVSNLQTGDDTITAAIATLRTSIIYDTLSSGLIGRIDYIEYKNKTRENATPEEVINIFKDIYYEAQSAITNIIASDADALPSLIIIRDAASSLVITIDGMNTPPNSIKRKAQITESIKNNMIDSSTGESLVTDLEAEAIAEAIQSGDTDELITALSNVSNTTVSSNASSIGETFSNLNSGNPDSQMKSIRDLEEAKVKLEKAKIEAEEAKLTAEQKEILRLEDRERSKEPSLGVAAKVNPIVVITNNLDGTQTKEMGYDGWDYPERGIHLEALARAITDYTNTDQLVAVSDETTISTTQANNLLLQVTVNLIRIKLNIIAFKNQGRVSLAPVIEAKQLLEEEIPKFNIISKDINFDELYRDNFNIKLDKLNIIYKKANYIISEWPG